MYKRNSKSVARLRLLDPRPLRCAAPGIGAQNGDRRDDCDILAPTGKSLVSPIQGVKVYI